MRVPEPVERLHPLVLREAKGKLLELDPPCLDLPRWSSPLRAGQQSGTVWVAPPTPPFRAAASSSPTVSCPPDPRTQDLPHSAASRASVFVDRGVSSADPARLGHRQRQAVQTRPQICDAARTLFARDGYVATTIVAINDAPGIPVPTIYSAMGTKARILQGIAWQLAATMDVDRHHAASIAVSRRRRARGRGLWERADRTPQQGLPLRAAADPGGRPRIPRQWRVLGRTSSSATRLRPWFRRLGPEPGLLP